VKRWQKAPSPAGYLTRCRLFFGYRFTSLEGDHIPAQLFAGVILNVREGVRQEATGEGIVCRVDLGPERRQEHTSLSRLSRFTETDAFPNLVDDTHGSAGTVTYRSLWRRSGRHGERGTATCRPLRRAVSRVPART
jgi:hypothetical protein